MPQRAPPRLHHPRVRPQVTTLITDPGQFRRLANLAFEQAASTTDKEVAATFRKIGEEYHAQADRQESTCQSVQAPAEDSSLAVSHRAKKLRPQRMG